MRLIRHRFGESLVLRDACLDLRAGEVHALVGENGAGKSTLMRIAAGLFAPESGSMTFLGRDFSPQSPSEALRAGIAMSHQELSLAADLTVAENILAGLEPCRAGFIDRKAMRRRVAAMLEEFCPGLHPDAEVASLGASYRQVVEILKTLAWEPRLVIFDEPTSSLDSREAELVLQTILKLKARSAGIVFVSHRMDEIFRVSDRITALRDGEVVATWKAADVSREEVLRAIIGRDLSQLYPPRAAQLEEELLRVEDFNDDRHFHDISFSVRRKEILGFCGLVGAGRTELMRAVFHADPADSGRVFLEGKPCEFRGLGDAIHAGLAYVPEDRKQLGLFLEQTVADNLTCASLKQCSRRGMIRAGACRDLAAEYCRRFRIAGASLWRDVRFLSGGNQQKVLLARWLAIAPKVLIVDEPTRGVDIGAKAAIHSLLREFAEAGNAVIVVSSEMPELIGLCDRILVMHEGRIAGEVPGPAATEQELIHLATGHPAQPAA